MESKIIALKSRFFLTRTLSYFSFFLIPIYVQKSLILPPFLKALLMTLYCSFMLGQWFLLGKEIDHRLKIYFEVNSSVDRIVYRLLLGWRLLFCIQYPRAFSYKWSINFFWFWILCGLFILGRPRKNYRGVCYVTFCWYKVSGLIWKNSIFLIVLFFFFLYHFFQM